MRKLVSIVIATVMIVALFTGCGFLQKLGLQSSDNDELHPVSSIVMNEDEAKKLTDKVPIHLYFATEDGAKLRMEVRYIPLSEAKKSTNALAGTILKELIKGPSTAGLNPTIPAGTSLKSVAVKDRVATVDFSKEFVDKHQGGKVAEQLTLYSVVNSLTELKDVEKVKFTINGKVQKEFKGSFKFDEPFPKNTAIISKQVTQSAASTLDNESEETIKEQGQSNTKTEDTKKQDGKKDDKGTGNSKSTGESKSTQGNDISDEDLEGVYLEELE